jgi:hypothetical protein
MNCSFPLIIIGIVNGEDMGDKAAMEKGIHLHTSRNG